MKQCPDINSLVVVSHNMNATIYRVVDTDPPKSGVGIIDATIEDRFPNQIPQWVDISILKAPSIGQLQKFNK